MRARAGGPGASRRQHARRCQAARRAATRRCRSRPAPKTPASRRRRPPAGSGRPPARQPHRRRSRTGSARLAASASRTGSARLAASAGRKLLLRTPRPPPPAACRRAASTTGRSGITSPAAAGPSCGPPTCYRQPGRRRGPAAGRAGQDVTWPGPDRGPRALDGYVRRAMVNTTNLLVAPPPSAGVPDRRAARPRVADHAGDSDLQETMRRAIDRLPDACGPRWSCATTRT